MNVQNIPRDDKVVKAAFRPKLDAFLYFDYPNIEAKMLAFYLDALRHPEMAAAFRGDGVVRLGLDAGAELDLHILTAAGVFNVPYGDLLARFKAGDKEADLRRQVGKRLNFSIIFGGGIPTLMAQGVAQDAKEALGLLRGYHSAWPGIGWASKRQAANEGTFAWWLKKRMQERGYVTTLWGRHLHPPSDHVLINHLVQGCSADLMKAALRKVHNHLRAEGFKSHLVNVVHDELALDAAADEIPELARVIPGLMDDERIGVVVPIRPEPDVSYTSWADKQPLSA